MIILIAAASQNNALGKNNDLIWHLPKDFKRFKALTTGHHIIMGRKTFESFPKPLPNRTSIVISRQADLQIDGAIIAHSVEEAILKAKSITREDIYIVGGAEIYALSLPLADQILVTQLHDIFEGDAFFPDYSKAANWLEVASESHQPDPQNLYSYHFRTLNRE